MNTRTTAPSTGVFRYLPWFPALREALKPIYYTSDLSVAVHREARKHTEVGQTEIHYQKGQTFVVNAIRNGDRALPYFVCLKAKRKRGSLTWIGPDRDESYQELRIAGERYTYDPLTRIQDLEAMIAVVSSFLHLPADEAVKDLGRTVNQCMCCGAFLTDPESKLRGIGPVCIKKPGVSTAWFKWIAKEEVH